MLMSLCPLQTETRPNLLRRIGELVPEDKAVLTVNDKSLSAPMRVLLKHDNSMAA